MALSELTLAMLTLAGYFQPDQSVAGQEHKYSSVMADLLRPISYRIADWGQYHVPDMELYRKLDDSSLGRQYKIYVTAKDGLQQATLLPKKRPMSKRPVSSFLIRLG